MSSVPLTFGNIEAIPIIHGELAFAVEVRERMLATRHRVLAVELPPSLEMLVQEGIDRLPVVHAVVYRHRRFGGQPLDLEGDPTDDHDDAWYVPIDPCDAIIEALRIARGERVRVCFVDAEIEEFAGRRLILPDAHAIGTLGLQAWYDAIRGKMEQVHPASDEDQLRERHMARRLAELSREVGEGGSVLFVCGLAHWRRIRAYLEAGDGALHDGLAPEASAIELVPVRHDSLFHALGEIPLSTWHWQQHRSGFAFEPHRPADSIPRILETARAVLAEQSPNSLDRPSTAALSSLVDFARKMTVRRRRLLPDLYTLVLAAKGTVGNDYAVAVLEAARTYPPNRLADGEPPPRSSLARSFGLNPVSRDDGPASSPTWLQELMEDESGLRQPEAGAGAGATDTVGHVGEDVSRMKTRTPGALRELRRLKLRGPPPELDRRLWRTVWNPMTSCSWPPEDVVIENFRSYLSNRALALAGIERQRVEEFVASMKDGLAIRETLRDLPLGRIFVKEEPRVPGQVGAVVMIFEEDDFGERYPWRLTWQAEHANESSLAFYATDFQRDLVGPGIGRAVYGGCMLLFPPQPIPDVWDDLRFERARTPSERLLLAALWYSMDRYVAHLAEKPPAVELREAAERLGKHIVHLPLSSMSSVTLEKLRRFHVLNGHEVRSWAARFIR